MAIKNKREGVYAWAGGIFLVCFIVAAQSVKGSPSTAAIIFSIGIIAILVAYFFARQEKS